MKDPQLHHVLDTSGAKYIKANNERFSTRETPYAWLL